MSATSNSDAAALQLVGKFTEPTDLNLAAIAPCAAAGQASVFDASHIARPGSPSGSDFTYVVDKVFNVGSNVQGNIENKIKESTSNSEKRTVAEIQK